MQTCFTKEKEEEMQCNVSLLQCKDFNFFCCLCAFSTMQPFFFLAMHICYNANLLHGRGKRSTLTFCFVRTPKKVIFFLLHFFGLQYFFFLWHAIILLHGIRRRNTHMLLFLATTYPMLFIFCCISFQLLCFFGCDASCCFLKFFPRLER